MSSLDILAEAQREHDAVLSEYFTSQNEAEYIRVNELPRVRRVLSIAKIYESDGMDAVLTLLEDLKSTEGKNGPREWIKNHKNQKLLAKVYLSDSSKYSFDQSRKYVILAIEDFLEEYIEDIPEGGTSR